MATQRIRIKLRAFDHKILDQSAERIVDTARRGSRAGRCLCRLRRTYTVLRSVHIDKDRGRQFEMRTHKRLIDTT